MNTILKTITLLSVLFLSIFFSPLSMFSPETHLSSSSPTKSPTLTTHVEPVNFTFFKNFHHENKDNTIEFPEMNLTSILSQVDSFNASDVNVYMGDDVIPGLTFPLYFVRVNLTQAVIYNDHDTGGPGEILFEITVNGNYSLDTNGGAYYVANNGETVYPTFIGFHGWLTQLEFTIHVWEADSLTFDDNLGYIDYSISTPVNETIISNTTLNDAQVSVQIEVFDSQNYITAHQLLIGLQADISVSDETSGTELPDDVFARVCMGQDEELGAPAICLQYFYYWDRVMDPTGLIQISQYDYQELLLFLDMNLDLYRVVFDAPDDIIDALPSHGYTIWEENGTGISTVMSNISEGLQPYLGSNSTVQFTAKDLDSEAVLKTSLLGFTTIQFTVDTYFHGFQMGPSGILGQDYGFLTKIDELNDTLIRMWYERLNESLEGDIHTIQIGPYSYTIPQVTPFTFDIVNPFQYPHLVNAWDNVMADIAAFQRAQQSQTSFFDQVLDFNVTFTIPAEIEISHPASVNPGQSTFTDISINILDDDVVLAFDYSVLFNASFRLWFLASDITKQQNGTISVRFPYNDVQAVLNSLGFLRNVGGPLTQTILNLLLAQAYLSIDDLSINPTVPGEIFNASLHLHLWHIARDFAPLPVRFIAWVADLIVDHLDLVINPSLEGLIRGDLAIDDPQTAQINQTDIEFNSTTTSINVPLIVSATPTSNSIILEINDLKFLFQFLVDWSLYFSLEFPFSLFAGPWLWSIGTYPEITYSINDASFASNSSIVVVIPIITGIGETFGGMVLILLTTVGVLVIWRKTKKDSKRRQKYRN